MSEHYIVNVRVTRVFRPTVDPKPYGRTATAPVSEKDPREIEEITNFTTRRGTLSSAARLVTAHLDMISEDSAEESFDD